ncbi:ABC-type lipopolysaccharide export system, ATPase component [Nonlabens sp. Hel1_33_55]|nr:ABC-type lipopolysaccharide export system, ATPase component [Nonlabens sp. Hel1_33_55]
MFHINSLSLSYGSKTILNDIDLTLKAGEIHGLLGLNGAGKSSLMQSLSGSNRKASCYAFINDNAINLKAQHLQYVAFLPQDPFVMKGVKVTDVVQYWYPDPEDQDKILYEPMLHSMHNKKVGVLSMGERRFLEFLLVFYLPHPFLMLDEPFSGLAPLQIQRVQELIKEKGSQKGILISDHYFDNILQITSQNWMLHHAKLTSIEASEVHNAYRKR